MARIFVQFVRIPLSHPYWFFGTSSPNVAQTGLDLASFCPLGASPELGITSACFWKACISLTWGCDSSQIPRGTAGLGCRLFPLQSSSDKNPSRQPRDCYCRRTGPSQAGSTSLSQLRPKSVPRADPPPLVAVAGNTCGRHWEESEIGSLACGASETQVNHHSLMHPTAGRSRPPRLSPRPG